MKVILGPILLLLSGIVLGQPPILQEMVAAEKAFAETSLTKSTKAAFVTFMHDSGYIFQDQPVKGKAFWEAAPGTNDLLSWEPVFASIAASGNLGYTTGPWEYRAHRDDTSAAAMGYYVSVWKKEASFWKVVLDIGISFPSQQMRQENFHTRPAKASTVAFTQPTGKKELMSLEDTFIEAQKTKGWIAYESYLTSGTRIYRPGTFPYLTTDEQTGLFQQTDKKFKYTRGDGMIASSGDLGYVFGKVDIEVSTDGNVRNLKGHYLRIWQRVKDNEWKIMLDLVAPAR